jgi:hypothetical protein
MPKTAFTNITRTNKLVAAGALLAAAGTAGAAASADTPTRSIAVANVQTRGHRSKARRKPAHHRHVAVHSRRKIGASASSSATASSSGYSIPTSIVMCESGGNYRAVNPSTGAGGAYQILPSTWAAYGGTGLPQNAAPAEQDAIAARIYASAGPSQWSCG